MALKMNRPYVAEKVHHMNVMFFDFFYFDVHFEHEKYYKETKSELHKNVWQNVTGNFTL